MTSHIQAECVSRSKHCRTASARIRKAEVEAVEWLPTIESQLMQCDAFLQIIHTIMLLWNSNESINLNHLPREILYLIFQWILKDPEAFPIELYVDTTVLPPLIQLSVNESDRPIDALGFYCDENSPLRVQSSGIASLQISDQIALQCKEWCSLLNQWNSSTNIANRSAIQCKMLQRVLRHPIPVPMRSEVWRTLLSLNELRANNKNLYSTLLKRESTCESPLSCDLRRCRFSFQNQYFVDENPGSQANFDILKAWSNHLKGATKETHFYRSGMGEFSSLLAMFLNTEESLFAIDYLFEGFLRSDQDETALVSKLIELYHPRMWQHAEQFHATILLTSFWYIQIRSLFSDLSLESSMHIFDVMIVSDSPMSTMVAFLNAIMAQMRNQFLAYEDATDLYGHFRRQEAQLRQLDVRSIVKVADIARASEKIASLGGLSPPLRPFTLKV